MATQQQRKSSSSNQNQQKTDPNEAARDLIVKGNKDVDISTLFDQFENADESMMENLNVEYFKFEEQGRYIFIALGTEEREFTQGGQTNKVTVAKLMDRYKNEFINGDRMLVSAVSRLKSVPQFIAVEYSGDKKTANGTYKELNVTALKQDQAGDLPF